MNETVAALEPKISVPASQLVPNVAYVVTATGAKQMLVPPDVPRYDPEWVSQREQYLLSKGWEKEAVQAGLPTYRDPKGSSLQGEYRDVAELPNKGDDLHKTITVRQFHVPSATYNFTIEEALDVQRRRDANGDCGPSPLERLDSCERRCNDLRRELEQVKARVKVLLTAQHITFDGLKLGLRELIGV